MKYHKKIKCVIHGEITISQLATKIINTEEFQRLKYIKQLGSCQFIYPSATHTRFDHSIGVYHLTGKILQILRSIYPNKLYYMPDLSETPIKLNDFCVELIKIGGLCHDIGHGPFSHLFDDILK